AAGDQTTLTRSSSLITHHRWRRATTVITSIMAPTTCAEGAATACHRVLYRHTGTPRAAPAPPAGPSRVVGRPSPDERRRHDEHTGRAAARRGRAPGDASRRCADHAGGGARGRPQGRAGRARSWPARSSRRGGRAASGGRHARAGGVPAATPAAARNARQGRDGGTVVHRRPHRGVAGLCRLATGGDRALPRPPLRTARPARG